MINFFYKFLPKEALILLQYCWFLSIKIMELITISTFLYVTSSLKASYGARSWELSLLLLQTP